MIKGKKLFRGIAVGVIAFVALAVLMLAGNYWIGKISLSKNIVSKENQGEYISHGGKAYVYRDNLINILCLGIDKEEQMALRNDVEDSIGQADAIFLVSLDTENKEVRILAIPRDTMVDLQRYDGNGNYWGRGRGQLTLQYAYADGLELSAELTAGQVSRLLNNIPINGYAAINVFSLWNLNAAIGGVDMYMDEDYTMFNPAFVQGTTVHLDENLLENYIRERDTSESGTAYARIHRLKKYILGFYEKAKEVLKDDITLPYRALKALEKDMVTSITAKDVLYLVSEVLECNVSEADMYTLPGNQVKGDEFEEFHIDQNAVNELLIQLFYEEM